jgi:nucleoside phosphorylase
MVDLIAFSPHRLAIPSFVLAWTKLDQLLTFSRPRALTWHQIYYEDMFSSRGQTLTRADYTVAWLTALPIELAAATAALDARHPDLERCQHDSNLYVLGSIDKHNVVIACLPERETGTNSAAFVAAQMKSSFRSIKIGLMVGIGGGVPQPKDVRLGDVVIGVPGNQHRGVVQHDFGTIEAEGEFKQRRILNGPPRLLLNAIAHLRAMGSLQCKLQDYLSKMNQIDPSFACPGAQNDKLFQASYQHADPKGSCDKCDVSYIIERPERSSPFIHYGGIASGNQVIKDASTRDHLAKKHNVLCFEMEAAGLMNNFPCLVIRGISDYADSHKDNSWKYYAAATSAAYAKAVLSIIPPEEVIGLDPQQTGRCSNKVYFLTMV